MPEAARSDTVGLVVPIRNPGDAWPRWLDLLDAQTRKPERTIVVDSSDDDVAARAAADRGLEVVRISPESFDHGESRQMGVRLLADSAIVVLCTQDAYMVDRQAVENLVGAFRDAEAGAAYGRQLPRPQARGPEAHARAFNYPPRSRVQSLDDAPRLGIKSGFISNAFAAYRRSALDEVGGFPHPILFGEDAIVGARLVITGWRIAYVAEARVEHSHGYSIPAEFRRHFDIGVLHALNPWLQQALGGATGEGLRFVRSELRYLARHDPAALIQTPFRTAAKLAGYRIGLAHARLPLATCSRLTMNPGYWRRTEQRDR